MRVMNCTQNNKQVFGCKNCDKAATLFFEHAVGCKREWTKDYLAYHFDDADHEKNAAGFVQGMGKNLKERRDLFYDMVKGIKTFGFLVETREKRELTNFDWILLRTRKGGVL